MKRVRLRGDQKRNLAWLVAAAAALGAAATATILKDDKLEKQAVTDLVERSALPKELKNELKTVFDVRKSRKKFIRFIEQHSSGFFKGGNFKAKHLKIKRANLGKELTVIYTARSK